MINDASLVERAEVIQEKGTNRQTFFRGQVDKYSWVDLGSSYAPSEINAAFLLAQLERAEEITSRRLELWERYHEGLEELERAECLRRPVIPSGSTHNAHMYYVLLRSLDERSRLISSLDRAGVKAVFHYVPLHSSDAGRRAGRAIGPMDVTDDVSDRLLRLPLWPDMGADDVDRVVDSIQRYARMSALRRHSGELAIVIVASLAALAVLGWSIRRSSPSLGRSIRGCTRL